MTLKKDKQEDADLLINWPAKYYDIADAGQRRRLLLTMIKKDNDPDDLKRLALLEKRYDFSGKKAADRFMYAWMMIKVMENESVSFFNRAAKKKQLREYMGALCLYEDYDVFLQREWDDFAKAFIFSCLNSKSFKATAFGMISVNDKNLSLRIAYDIDMVTRIIPSRFDLADDFKPLSDTMIKAYKTMLEDGEAYWEDHFRLM